MKRQVLIFSAFAAVMLIQPTFAADGTSDMLGVRWGKNAFNFEGMPSGPQPLRNLSRLPNGKANARQLVGDFQNPVLTPDAAAVVKQKGELAIAGKGFPNAQDQCRPMSPPFALADRGRNDQRSDRFLPLRGRGLRCRRPGRTTASSGSLTWPTGCGRVRRRCGIPEPGL